MHKDWKEAIATIATVETHTSRSRTTYEAVFTFQVDGGYYGGTYTSDSEVCVADLVTPI